MNAKIGDSQRLHPDRPWWGANRTLFLFLQTRVALSYADGALNALSKCWKWPNGSMRYFTEMISVGPGETWVDGIVLRITATTDAPDFVTATKFALDHFENWMVFDDKNCFVEKVIGGPMSIAFADEKDDFGSSMPRRGTLFFLQWADGQQSFERAIDDVRSQLPVPLRLVFPFRDGRILHARIYDPGKITLRRLDRTLQRLPWYRFIDHSCETFASSGADAGCWSVPRFWDLIRDRPSPTVMDIETGFENAGRQ